MSPDALTFPGVATAGGFWLVLAIIVPIFGILGLWRAGPRHTERVGLATLAAGLVVALAIGFQILRSGESVVYFVGGWAPPLGLALRADGLSGVMVVMTAIILGATGLYACGQFGFRRDGIERRAPLMFWTMILAIWSALNLIFLGDDLFNLYVALELLTFAAVPLVSLDGSKATMQAALRYLVFALIGSVLYLLGTAMIYGAYGTLDIVLLSRMAGTETVLLVAVALMTLGLIAKTALFPLHLWLPPAHAGAPAAASAVLSALVVKGSFFIILRLWFDVLPPGIGEIGVQGLGTLGAGAILFGSVLALRQPRLKLLIAYSTVAQIGYLFLVFPLATGSGAVAPWEQIAWTGGVLQLASHAFAKAGMFMAAGLIYDALGHDRIDGFAGLGKALPLTVLTFGLAGMSLLGLPPSGGFSAKWLMLSASLGEGQWWWAIVIILGGLIAAGYIFRVLAPALGSVDQPLALKGKVSRRRECVALSLAVIAILLGFVPLKPSETLQIGRLVTVERVMPDGGVAPAPGVQP